LAEIRQLRLAIERSTLLGMRMQISLQRIQMQEMRTTRISQELERARKDAADSQLGYVTGNRAVKERRRNAGTPE